MSNTPPRRGQQRPASGGARRAPQSQAPAPPPNPNRSLPSRRAGARGQDVQPEYDQYDQQYDQYDQYGQYDQQYDQYDQQYERDNRYRAADRGYRNAPQRGRGRGGPPPPQYRRSGRQAYAPPRRDAFPIIMGAMVGALFVGLLIVVYLLINRSGTSQPPPVASTAPTALSASDAGQPTTAAMAQATSATGDINVSATQTMGAKRPAGGLGTPMPDEGNAHVNDGDQIVYKNYPPSSGTHYPNPAAAGFYTKTVPEGNFVHSMEHGYVVLYYKPDLPAATIDQLKGLMTQLPNSKYGKVKMVIVPYTHMDTPLTLAAWDRLLPMTDYNFDVIKTFYQEYVDNGPEDVP